MKIRTIFDKKTRRRSLHTGWGVSFLVDDRFLFDTGEDGDMLIGNMAKMGVDIGRIKGVIISHDHWDHWGGLWGIMGKRKGIKVYACPNFSKGFKDKVIKYGGRLVESGGFRRISEGIFVSGEISGTYKRRNMPEQALVIKTGKGISVITGCAHPGIVKMAETAARRFPDEKIYAVLGGFHLMKEGRPAVENVADSFKRIGVKKAGPTHCSGEEAEKIFKGRYKDDFIPVRVGENLEV
jgi:7,8-dihydropterin-6-yl-methyl-4-(beta-D-ribofuranosyl)aminobenzene 5'-phosphate synthase